MITDSKNYKRYFADDKVLGRRIIASLDPVCIFCMLDKIRGIIYF